MSPAPTFALLGTAFAFALGKGWTVVDMKQELENHLPTVAR